MPTNEELKELNDELKQAGYPALGQDEDDEAEGESAEEGDDVESQDTVVVPGIDELEAQRKEEESEEDEEEDSDEEDESEDESGEEDEDNESEPSDQQRHTVPYSQYKDETGALKEQIEFWKEAAKRHDDGKGTPAEEAAATQEPDVIQAAAQELAKELGLDEAKTKLLVTKIVETAKAQALPKEIMDRLARFDKISQDMEQRQIVEQEQSYFDKEWSGFQPVLQKAYPNATPDQLAKAKAAMDIISHAPRFAQIPDLEYIFSKSKQDFDAILFSPKKKAFERGRQGGTFDEENREFQPPEIGSEDPDSIAKLEETLYGSEEEEENAGMSFYSPAGKKMR